MNLGDPEWELIDPTPNVNAMFMHFDNIFFYGTLKRVTLRWSKRMFSSAGLCRYKNDTGECDIALSEPLLKLRPRKDLVETLLHEMIHAYLFVTNRDNDRDGHGPTFQSHMHRINRAAKLNISVYHTFTDEVYAYRTHWWRCDGKCRLWSPHFGICRRTCNRKPSPADYWWANHRRLCGGTFFKIKEPPQANTKETPMITKKNYINTANDVIKDKVKPLGTRITQILVTTNKTCKNAQSNSPAKTVNAEGTLTLKPIKLANIAKPSQSSGKIQSLNSTKTNKQKTGGKQEVELPKKIMKIDDYFKTSAKVVLKDIYGEDFNLTACEKTNQLQANINDLVECPVCHNRINKRNINKHLDECLNTEIIEKIAGNDTNMNTETSPEYKHEHNPGNSTTEKDSVVQPIAETKPSSINKTNKSNKTQKRKSIKNDDYEVLEESVSKSARKSDTKDDAIYAVDLVDEHVGDVVESAHCSCCGINVDNMDIIQHLEECTAFAQGVGASTSAVKTICTGSEKDNAVETLKLNPNGTMSPCPCCLVLVEHVAMNDHLDLCLGIKK